MTPRACCATSGWQSACSGCWRGRGADLLPAAGRIAAATPLLLIDAGPDRKAEALERLRVEFGERVAAAGDAADVGRMASALARLAAPRNVALSLVAPASRLMCAYLFSIATCETVRCERDACAAARERASGVRAPL